MRNNATADVDRIVQAMLAILQTSPRGGIRFKDLLERTQHMTGIPLDADAFIKERGWNLDDMIVRGQNFEPAIKVAS